MIINLEEEAEEDAGSTNKENEEPRSIGFDFTLARVHRIDFPEEL